MASKIRLVRENRPVGMVWDNEKKVWTPRTEENDDGYIDGIGRFEVIDE